MLGSELIDAPARGGQGHRVHVEGEQEWAGSQEEYGGLIDTPVRRGQGHHVHDSCCGGEILVAGEILVGILVRECARGKECGLIVAPARERQGHQV